MRKLILATTCLIPCAALAQLSGGGGVPPADVQAYVLGYAKQLAPNIPVTFGRVTLDATDVVNASQVGDLVATLQWDGLGCPTINEPTGHLTLAPCSEVVRVAKPLTDLPAGSTLAFTVTEGAPVAGMMGPIPGYTPVTSAASLAVDAPPVGPAVDISAFIDPTVPPIVMESFPSTWKSELYQPSVLADYATPNPHANEAGIWLDFRSQTKPANPRTPANLHANYYSGSGGRNNGDGAGQLFASPLVGGYDPFSLLKGGGLVMTAAPIPAGSPFKQYFDSFSGSIELQQPLPPNACFEMRAISANIPGLWPQFGWLFAQAANWQEFDLHEGHWFSPSATQGTTMYLHRPEDSPDLQAQNHSQQNYFAGGDVAAYHTFTGCLSNDQVFGAIDHNVMFAINRPVEWSGPWSFIGNLAVNYSATSTASAPSPNLPAADFSQYTGGKAKAVWDFMRAWKAKDHFPVMIPHGVPPLVNQPVSGPYLSADGTGATIGYGTNLGNEPPSYVQTAWKLHGAAAYAHFSLQQPLPANGASVGTAAVIGTPPGTAIDMALYQGNAAGLSRPYEFPNITTNGVAPTPVPGAVTSLNAISQSAGAITVSLAAPSGGVQPDHYLEFERLANTQVAAPGYIKVSSAGTNGLTRASGHTYQVDVWACNAGQTSASPGAAEIAATCGPVSTASVTVQ